MTVENYLAEAGALAGLAGVLAGFSLAAVVQLLTSNNGGRLTTAGIELCKSLQHRVAADAQAARIVEAREAPDTTAAASAGNGNGKGVTLPC